MVLQPRPSPAPSLRLSHQHSAVFYDGGRLSRGVPSSVARAGRGNPPAVVDLLVPRCGLSTAAFARGACWAGPQLESRPLGSSTCTLGACPPWRLVYPWGDWDVCGVGV